MTSEEIKNLSIEETKSGLFAREITAKEIAETYIAEARKGNEEINAFITITEEAAIEAAERIDRKIESKEELGALAGTTFAIKDNLLFEGERCTAGSKILSDYVASYDATVIKKLKEADAIIVGKANLDEFAMGSSTENSAFGTVKNPADKERVPGGSSGGSAASVAAKMSLSALGTDTGGSIRLPAGFCGAVGMKPTYGRVSRFGAIAMASSLDQIGPFARTVREAEKVYDVIKGADHHDSTSIDVGESQLPIGTPSAITIGLPNEFFVKGSMDQETGKALDETIAYYSKLGFKIKEVNLPYSKYALPSYYIVMFAEVSTNLARYDGIRYSRGSDNTDDLLSIYLETRGKGFGAEVKRRALLGAFVLSAGYYDAYYAKAQKVRQLIKQDFINAFNEADVILAPASPTLPFKIGEKSEDPVAMYMSDIFTVPVNLAGIPAMTIPVKGREGKLPVGFQLMGKHWHEGDLFELGRAYEEN